MLSPTSARGGLRRLSGFLFLLLPLSLWALPATALTGQAVSTPDTLDSLPPQVLVSYPIGGELFLATEPETLRWTISEDSWSPSAEPVELLIRDGGAVLLQETVAPSAGGLYSYVWDVPLGIETTAARFAVSATDRFGWTGADSSATFAIEDHISDVPAQPLVDRLGPAWPNPFNPSTTISYSLRRAGHIRLGIYDLRGRLVRLLVDGPQTAGEHDVSWQGRDRFGAAVPSGAYFARMTIGDDAAAADSRGQLVTRLTLLK